MKALFFNQHGTIDALHYGEVETPKPKANEVLIRTGACALNRLDLWVLKGWRGLNLKMPHIGGADIAGTVIEKGSKVLEAVHLGERVVVYPGIRGPEDEWTKKGEESVSPGYSIIGESRHGGFAEFVTVPAANVYPLPDSVSFSGGAAPLLVALTCFRMLKHRAKLKKGETILVVGAGGGVNSLAIQLAASFGANVIALTSSNEKAGKARALGAKAVINYRETPDWDREVLGLTARRGADVIVDNVGQATLPRSLRAAARGGRIVTVGNTSGHAVTIDNRYLFSKQLSIIGSTMGNQEDFEEVLKLLWSRTINPVIDREIPLQDGREAYRLLEHGKQFGKIVLLPQ